MIATLHPERSARSFFVNARDALVPRADEIVLIAASGLSMTDITQPDTDCVAENLSAFVDDHLSVKVDALAIADAALFTVKFALGRIRARSAGKGTAVDVPIFNGACIVGGTMGGVVVASMLLGTLFILGCVEVEATMGSVDDADDAKR